MKKSLSIFIVLLLTLLMQGCDSATQVSYNQLIEKTKSWKEPKVAIWYYVGSDKDFNYFHFHDLNKKEIYKVLKNEMKIEYNFELTKDRNKWKVMPWGVQAKQEKK